MYERVWDEADYVVPPAENGAFFVTTNVVITPNQTRGYCPEVAAFCILFQILIFSFLGCLLIFVKDEFGVLTKGPSEN